MILSLREREGEREMYRERETESSKKLAVLKRKLGGLRSVTRFASKL